MCSEKWVAKRYLKFRECLLTFMLNMVYDRLKETYVFSWTVILSGYARVVNITDDRMLPFNVASKQKEYWHCTSNLLKCLH